MKGGTQAKEEKDTPETQHRTLSSIYKRLLPKKKLYGYRYTQTHTQRGGKGVCLRGRGDELQAGRKSGLPSVLAAGLPSFQ